MIARVSGGRMLVVMVPEEKAALTGTV